MELSYEIEMVRNKLVSIIVAVYNVKDYIDECIASLCNQTYQNLDIILIDDGSTDESGKKCELSAKEDDRITVIHQTNQGLSAARNSGIGVASGDYIMFVDGDDWLPLDSVEKLLAAILQTDADFSQGLFSYAAEGSIVPVQVPRSSFKEYNHKEAVYSFLESGPAGIEVAAWGKLYKKSIFDKVSYPVGMLHEDMFTTCEIVLKHTQKAIVIGDVVYIYRQHGNSITHTRSVKKYVDCYNSQEYVSTSISKVYPEMSSLADYMLYNTILLIVYDNPSWILNNCKNMIKTMNKRIRKICVSDLYRQGVSIRLLFHFVCMQLSLRCYLKIYNAWKRLQDGSLCLD